MGLGSRSSVDAEALRVALGGVSDPEIGRPIGELGMLGEVEVDRRGRVDVTVRLTVASCPLTEEFRARTTAAAMSVPGVTGVDVRFGELGARERADLAATLRGGSVDLTNGLGMRTRIYAVASGKGGVGKSTVTANLAAALARGGSKVGVIDADVWGYSIPGLFGVQRSPVVVGGLMMPIQAHGVSLISTGFLVPDGTPVVWRGPMLHKALEQFLHDVHWGDLDVLLLDLPPGTGDIQMSLLELLPSAAMLAVTTPQDAARTVAQRVVRMAREASMPIAGVVENMSSLACDHCGQYTDLFGSGGGEALALAADAPLLGQVPLDRALRAAGDAGVPVVLADPLSHSAQALARISAALPVVRRPLAGPPLPLSVVSAT
jgi:ATP-binding protein involved in chromosome partitioning